MAESAQKLDADALALFARKGEEGGPGTPQVGEANAVNVRRVMQITQDLAGRPFDALRILDLGCGDGVYAIEAALRGAEVLAIDARTQNTELGAACAARHGLDNVQFRQEDVRKITRESHGEFDVVYCLGILYHLDVPDVFSVLENVEQMCSRMAAVDTFISLEGGWPSPREPARVWGRKTDLEVTHRDQVYEGERLREHDDEDSDEVRRSRTLRSIDNTFSFRFTRSSLVRALRDVGFSSVFECHSPAEPGKPENRVTVVAMKGEGVSIATYPWLNEMSEVEIARRLQASE
jgi:SAM-dependent methyltransferase